MDNAISDEVRRLVASGVKSMDHVDFLFHLGSDESTVADLAKATRFTRSLVDSLAEDLEKAELVTRKGDMICLTMRRRDCEAIQELLAIYNSRPVTLVRAIYARETLSRAVTDALTPRPIE